LSRRDKNAINVNRVLKVRKRQSRTRKEKGKNLVEKDPAEQKTAQVCLIMRKPPKTKGSETERKGLRRRRRNTQGQRRVVGLQKKAFPART